MVPPGSTRGVPYPPGHFTGMARGLLVMAQASHNRLGLRTALVKPGTEAEGRGLPCATRDVPLCLARSVHPKASREPGRAWEEW